MSTMAELDAELRGLNDPREPIPEWKTAAWYAADCPPPGSHAALLAELTAAIRELGHQNANGEDQTHCIRNGWMMRLLTRCEASLGLAPGGSTQ